MHATEHPYPEEVLVGSKPHWLWPDGTLLPVVRGGDGSEDDNDDDDGDGGEPPKPDADGKFSQADLDRIAKKARREGNKSGKLKQAKDLGFETVEEMQAALAEHRSARDKAKSEEDKAREKLLKDQQLADEKSAKADRERFDLRCERALLRAGCPDAVVERAAKLLDLKVEDLEDLEPDDFKEAAEKLKEEVPGLFAASTGGEDPPNPDSDPGNPPRRSGGKKTAREIAQEQFDRNHPKPKVST